LLNLRKQVEEIIRDLGPIADLSETTITNEVPTDVEVYSETRLLNQIIQNLISNALKFAPEGNVIIRARREKDGSVPCQVIDNGSGIPPEVIDKVFDRFETVGPTERRGIGLGLAIVKEIIELHGGEIRVQSQLGKGTTFTFVLPGAPAE
jgi:two-component system, OmpR family, phosphate regulon sensor histidine kinase PhoR